MSMTNQLKKDISTTKDNVVKMSPFFIYNTSFPYKSNLIPCANGKVVL
jgi:hypothetical protein